MQSAINLAKNMRLFYYEQNLRNHKGWAVQEQGKFEIHNVEKVPQQEVLYELILIIRLFL